MTDYTILDHISTTQGVRDITRFDEVTQLVIETTARYFILTPEELHAKTRMTPIPEARYFVFWAMLIPHKHTPLQKWYRWKLSIVGDIFGKDHATAMHGDKVITGNAQTSRDKYDLYESICRDLFHRSYPDALKKLQNIKRIHVNNSVWK